MKITRAGATVLLDRDIKDALNAIERNGIDPASLTSGQQAALVSWVFNEGEGNLASSTLLQKILAGDMDGAAEEFPRWKFGTVDGVKVVLPGLVTRRREEVRLWKR